MNLVKKVLHELYLKIEWNLFRYLFITVFTLLYKIIVGDIMVEYILKILDIPAEFMDKEEKSLQESVAVHEFDTIPEGFKVHSWKLGGLNKVHSKSRDTIMLQRIYFLFEKEE